MPDAMSNFAVSSVTTAPSPDVSGTSLVVASASPFPSIVPFNLIVSPANTQPLASNSEIVRVTAISGTTFTIVRAQEGSTARAIVSGDRIIGGLTTKTIADISPKGNANSVQFYDGAVQQGAALTGISTSGSLTIGVDTTLPMGSANASTLFSKSLATRTMLAQNDSTGHDTTLQPFMARNRIHMIAGMGSANTFVTIGGMGFTTAGTMTTRNPAFTSGPLRLKRTGAVTATTAGSMAELRIGASQHTAGTGSSNDASGYYMETRFMPSNAAAVSGERFFIGMTASSVSSATNVEPNTLVNTVGIAQLSTDATQFYLVYGGTTAQTAIACGTAIGSPGGFSTDAFDLIIWAPGGVANTYYVQLTNMFTGVTFSRTLTGAAAVVPISSVGTHFKAFKTNNATALASGFDLVQMYLETDS